MTNEKKALQLAGLNEISEEERYYQSSKCEIYDKCLEMAAWKEQQMIEKACDWLKKSTILADTTIERFKQAMEE